MNNYIPFLIFLLILVSGCSDPVDTTNTDNDVLRGEPFDIIDVISNDSSFTEIDENIQHHFNARAGYTYSVLIEEKGDGYSVGTYSIQAPDGEKVGVGRTTFQAVASGVYTLNLGVYLIDTSLNGPYKYSVTVREYPRIENSLQGKWLLVRSHNSALGTVYTDRFSISDAFKIIDIVDDSLIEYEYYAHYNYNMVYRSASLFANESYMHSNYEITDSSLTFMLKHAHGYSEHEYIRFTGEIDDVSWRLENYSIPEQFHGTWFQKKSYDAELELRNGIETKFITDETFQNGNESSQIVIIRQDSITFYGKSGWGISTDSRSAGDVAWFTHNSEIINNEIIQRGVELDVRPEEWELYVMNSCYAKYKDEIPPNEWYNIQVPEKQRKLSVDSTYREEVNLYDSIWYEIKLEKDVEYTLRVNEINCEAAGYVIDSEPKQLLAFDNHGTFTPDKSGTYYIGVIIWYHHNSYSDRFSEVTVSKK